MKKKYKITFEVDADYKTNDQADTKRLNKLMHKYFNKWIKEWAKEQASTGFDSTLVPVIFANDFDPNNPDDFDCAEYEYYPQGAVKVKALVDGKVILDIKRKIK